MDIRRTLISWSKRMYEAVEEHYKKDCDTLRALTKVDNHSFIAIDRGRYTKQAYKALKCWEDAEDAVQEAYRRILTAVSRGRVIEDIDKYFTIALRSSIIDTINYNRGRPPTVHPDTVDKLEAINEEILSYEEIAEVVKDLTHRFTSREKDILYLRYEENLPYSDIQNILGISKVTVWNALNKLNKAIEKYNVDS